MNISQYIPALSILHKLDPRTKIITVALVAGAIFTVQFPFKLGFLCLFILLLIPLSRINPVIYLKSLRPFVFIILLTFLVQIFLIPGPNLWQWGYLRISSTGFNVATALIMRIIALILLARILTATSSVMSLTEGLGNLLRPMARTGLPVQELIMIMTISMRFIPIFSESVYNIRRAQQGRGVDLNSGPLSKRLKHLLAILVPLFRIAFERANDLAEAMESRAFQGHKQRGRLYELQLQSYDYGAFILTTVILALMIII